MRKTVGILDEITEYGERLAGAINIRANKSLRAAFIRDPFEVKEMIATDRIQLLLVSEKYAWEEEEASVPVFFLTDENCHEVSGPGDRKIPRYSQVTDIIDNLLSEADIKVVNDNEKIAVVFSPDSAEEAMKAAYSLALMRNKSGSTVFLPFDNFYAGDGSVCLTELLYAGLGPKDSFMEKLDGIKAAGVGAVSGPAHFSDLWQYTEEQMNNFIDMIQEAGFSHIVAGCGFISDSVYMLFKRADAIYVPGMKSVRYEIFLQQLMADGDGSLADKVREPV